MKRLILSVCFLLLAPLSLAQSCNLSAVESRIVRVLILEDLSNFMEGGKTTSFDYDENYLKTLGDLIKSIEQNKWEHALEIKAIAKAMAEDKNGYESCKSSDYACYQYILNRERALEELEEDVARIYSKLEAKCK